MLLCSLGCGANETPTQEAPAAEAPATPVPAEPSTPGFAGTMRNAQASFEIANDGSISIVNGPARERLGAEPDGQLLLSTPMTLWKTEDDSVAVSAFRLGTDGSVFVNTADGELRTELRYSREGTKHLLRLQTSEYAVTFDAENGTANFRLGEPNAEPETQWSANYEADEPFHLMLAAALQVEFVEIGLLRGDV